MNSKVMKLTDLVPAGYNPRKALQPGDAEYEKIKRSISQFGLVEPLIWNERTNTLVGGHQRLKVLMDMGIAEAECVIVDLDLDKEKALNVALNKITGEWDDSKLQTLFADLEAAGYDTSFTGFEAVEIEDLFKDSLKETMKQDSFDVDAAAEEPPFAKPGDLWFLNEHRIFCGPLLNGTQLLMNGNGANLVIADVSRIAPGSVFFRDIAECMAPDASIYVFHKESSSLATRAAFEDAGYHLSNNLLWARPAGDEHKGSTPYSEGHVPCLYGWKNGDKHKWYADRKQSSVWDISAAGSADELPVQVVGYPIVNSSMRNCIVLDPCLGHGAVLVACEQLQRICYGAENDPSLVSAAVKRYIDLVGSSLGVSVMRDGLTYEYVEVVK